MQFKNKNRRIYRGITTFLNSDAGLAPLMQAVSGFIVLATSRLKRRIKDSKPRAPDFRPAVREEAPQTGRKNSERTSPICQTMAFFGIETSFCNSRFLRPHLLKSLF